MSDFEEELALAISLSLQEQHSRATNSKDEPIIIIDSSDDEGTSTSNRVKPSKTLAKGSSSKVSSTVSKPTPSMKSLDLTRHTKSIDVNSPLNIEDEDTATESESDEETGATTCNSSADNEGKMPSRAHPSLLVYPVSGTSTKIANTGSVAGQSLAPSSSSLLSFRAERAKMEQERLARLKRRRPDLAADNQKAEEDDEGSEEEVDKRPAKRPSPDLISKSSASTSKGKDTTSEMSYSGSFNVPDKSGLFWHGALRQTANKHANPTQDREPVFRLTSDILPPVSGNMSSGSSTSADSRNALSFAIVSSYALDLPWIYSLFPPSVPVILVTQPGQDGRADVHHTLPGWVRASPELAGGRGCMHVKLLLLFYKSGRLRVVIPTANFVPYDWRDIENSVWLQDIPLLTGPLSPSSHIGTSKHGVKTEGFAERLERVLKALNVAPALEAHLMDQREDGDVRLPLRTIDELHSRWDWSRVTAHLIPSIAGKHTGWPVVLQVGHVALMKAIRDIGAATERVKIECQGSSIGSYSTRWTNEFMSSAKGISPDAWLDSSRGRWTKAPHPAGLKIVFPSLRTVDASVLGRPGGGTIFCNRKQWGATTFPKTHFVDSNSKRGNILMHSKMILGILDDEDLATNKPEGWLYVGSHNFTPSAWGNLSGSGFTPVMNITNYELGIIMPLGSLAEGDRLACWKRPARPYVQGQDEPWMQTEHM